MNNEKNLDNEQLEVVNNLKGTMLVIAGAGTGKTTTITHSVAKLMNSGINPSDIMLVTFTNKAAKEMITRVKDLLGFMPSITAGTFHSIANIYFLKKFRNKIRCDKHNYYTIMNSEQAKELIKLCIEDSCRKEIENNSNNANITDEDEDKLLKKMKKQYPKARNIQEIISYSRNTNKSIEEFVKGKFFDFEPYLDKIREITKRYEDKKIETVHYDFDDLLDFWNRLLDDDEVKEQAKKYKYILVDEYQDTNFVQNEIILKLARLNEDSCLLVVGDDSQSIYAFRGADFQNFLNFEKNFKKLKRYNITYNRRSCPEILNLANNSITHNKVRFKKEMKPTKNPHKKPLFVETESFNSQIDYIIDKILEMLNNGVPYSEIALLFRSLKGERKEIRYINELMIKLVENKIPFEVRGGKSLFEKAHIKDLIAFLSFIDQPKGVFSEIYWKRIRKNYIKGLGEETSKKIFDHVIKNSKNPLRELSNYQELMIKIGTLKRNKIVNRLNKNALNNIHKLIRKLYSLRGENVGIVIEKLFKDPLIKESFEATYKQNEYDNTFQERLADIDLIVDVGRRFRTIREFLNDLSLNENEYIENKTSQKEKERIIISTIHRAKGLQWTTVFVPMLENGFFPSFQNMENEEDLEEERRVFYVSVTRAKKDLFLLTSKFTGKRDELESSLFIQELNPNTYEKILL